MPQHVLPPPSRPNPPPLLFPFWLLLPFHRYPTLSTLHLLVLLLSLSLSLSFSLCSLSSPPRQVFFHMLQQPNIFIRPLGGVAHVRLLKRFHPEKSNRTRAFPPPLPRFYSSPLFFSSFHVLFIVPKREERRRTLAVSTCTVGRSSIRASVSLSARNEPDSRI